MASADPAGGLVPGVTVLGNLAIDRIDGGAPSPGGCPTFAGPALIAVGGGAARIVARAAPADASLFQDVLAGAGVPVDVLPAQTTSAFGMHYTGDVRAMTVDAIGPAWDADAIRAARITTTWVHVAPLLRSDFPPAAIAALQAAGHRVAYDGQGLVRRSVLGPLAMDGAGLIAGSGAPTGARPGAGEDGASHWVEGLEVLKLADEEAAALFGGEPTPDQVAGLGIPEVLITAGSGGCVLHLGRAAHAVPPPWKVEGVHATGAGDVFTVAYVGARARGDEPLAATHVAGQVVAEMLQTRLESQR